MKILRWHYLEVLLRKMVFFYIFHIFLLFVCWFVCLPKFFVFQSYANKISYSYLVNEAFIKKYNESFYFLITTMTTIGNGDILCISSYERIFHIILLWIGIILHSFIVNKISKILWRNKIKCRAFIKYKINLSFNAI